jgi:fructokinase
MDSIHEVVCFGEVLWDILPTGAVPGGAPMNVAYHLHKLKQFPAVITRIGDDEEGKELRNIFFEHGISTDYFQIDKEHETGKVYAKPNEHNEVTYDIVQPVAWDFIEWKDEFEILLKGSQYFVFGSLAARNKQSRDTLFRALDCANTKVLDINLRAPHYDPGIVQDLLNHAEFLKMNAAELELIAGWYAAYSNIEDRIKLIRDRFNIHNIIVTMGGDGAMLYMNNRMMRHNGFKVNVMDTVGSGDAFLAGFLSRIIAMESAGSALEFASAMGAFIATKKGACPDYDVADVYSLIKLAV